MEEDIYQLSRFMEHPVTSILSKSIISISLVFFKTSLTEYNISAIGVHRGGAMVAQTLLWIWKI